MYNEYAQLFDWHCRNYTRSPVMNLRYLRECQKQCNHFLLRDGYLFLKDVFTVIGIPEIPNMDGIGWWLDLYNENSNFVDFGIYDHTSKTSRNFVNGLCPEIILHFNVDGNLADYLMDLGMHIGGPDMAREFFENSNGYRDYLYEMGYLELWED